MGLELGSILFNDYCGLGISGIVLWQMTIWLSMKYLALKNNWPVNIKFSKILTFLSWKLWTFWFVIRYSIRSLHGSAHLKWLVTVSSYLNVLFYLNESSGGASPFHSLRLCLISWNEIKLSYHSFDFYDGTEKSCNFLNSCIIFWFYLFLVSPTKCWEHYSDINKFFVDNCLTKITVVSHKNSVVGIKYPDIFVWPKTPISDISTKCLPFLVSQNFCVLNPIQGLCIGVGAMLKEKD